MPRVPAGGGDGAGTLPGFWLFVILVPCFFLIILLLLAAMQYKQMKTFISDSPAVLDTIPDSAAAEARVSESVRAFFRDGGDTLSLGTAEANHMVRACEALERAGWRYHITLEDSLFSAASSTPAREMHGPASVIAKVMRMEGWMNSVIRARPELKDGKLTLVPVAAEMNAVKAPASVLSKKGAVDPREWVADKAFYDSALAALAEVKVERGRLLLVKKP